ncbi:MAG: septum site-determining protein MinC [Lachnospiraceae bacterium]
MNNTVIIKGNRYGISIVLDKDLEFSQLLKDLEIRLENAEEFFDSDKQLAVTFEGRALSNDELDQVLSVIKTCSKLNIQYVMDENSELETTFFDIIQTARETEAEQVKEAEPVEVSGIFNTLQQDEPDTITPAPNPPTSDNSGMFYKGTLRSGQTLESKESIVIIGDVNPGAAVIAAGNIVIIGALKGNATAGANGNKNAFVMALVMDPIQIQIADIIARSSDTQKNVKVKQEAMIATVMDDQICIESVSKTAIQDINF